MMAQIRLIDVLPDFAPPPRQRTDAVEHVSPVLSRQPGIDIDAMIATAVAQAEEELAARLAAERDAALEAERERHRAELAEQAHRLGALAGQSIATRLGEAEAALSAHTSAAVARVLGTILTDELQRRSIESLARSVREALHDQEAVRIRVSGPQALFESLAAMLPERAESIEYSESSAFDLTVAVDGTLYETRLSEWASALAEILA